jgi:hypothetical protein
VTLRAIRYHAQQNATFAEAATAEQAACDIIENVL